MIAGAENGKVSPRPTVIRTPCARSALASTAYSDEPWRRTAKVR
jgi:hypothetical protein